MGDRLCAVKDCLEEGRRQTCPYDGQRHWHGRIHYTEGYGLEFRDGDWYQMCSTHMKLILGALTKRVLAL